MRKLEIEMAHPRRCAGAYRIVSEKGAGREPKPQIIHLSYCAAVFGWTHARHIDVQRETLNLPVRATTSFSRIGCIESLRRAPAIRAE
jgi:hypothetical protein